MYAFSQHIGSNHYFLIPGINYRRIVPNRNFSRFIFKTKVFGQMFDEAKFSVSRNWSKLWTFIFEHNFNFLS